MVHTCAQHCSRDREQAGPRYRRAGETTKVRKSRSATQKVQKSTFAAWKVDFRPTRDRRHSRSNEFCSFQRLHEKKYPKRKSHKVARCLAAGRPAAAPPAAPPPPATPLPAAPLPARSAGCPAATAQAAPPPAAAAPAVVEATAAGHACCTVVWHFWTLVPNAVSGDRNRMVQTSKFGRWCTSIVDFARCKSRLLHFVRALLHF